jgi:hypothetical protein
MSDANGFVARVGGSAMDTFEDAFEHDRALVFGIGGGGDVVGAVPTARLLESRGVETILGGVTWERWPVDPHVGPRPLSDVENARRVSDAVALATGDTRTRDGVAFAETGVAAHYGEPVALVDITGGVGGTVAGLDAACEALDVDLVVGTDSGGDALAAGGEHGLRSPLADAVGLATLDGLETDTLLGVFGYGSDGELSTDELDDGVGRAASRDGLLGAWGLTPRVADELDGVLQTVETEASRLPVEALRGRLGERRIRGGERRLELTPASTLTFYLDPGAVAATSEPASLVADSRSLDAADEALAEAGYRTELAAERERRRKTE